MWQLFSSVVRPRSASIYRLPIKAYVTWHTDLAISVEQPRMAIA
jgi:hypothetical protein